MKPLMFRSSIDLDGLGQGLQFRFVLLGTGGMYRSARLPVVDCSLPSGTAKIDRLRSISAVGS
ncbi:hypothetical protein GW17_00052621 [Ensete ventricosum]|nr:hypothetical protein GW17_00052621 [Ensete ventricosum]